MIIKNFALVLLIIMFVIPVVYSDHFSFDLCIKEKDQMKKEFCLGPIEIYEDYKTINKKLGPKLIGKIETKVVLPTSTGINPLIERYYPEGVWKVKKAWLLVWYSEFPVYQQEDSTNSLATRILIVGDDAPVEYTTARKIRLGSMKADVLKAYGSKYESGTNKDGTSWLEYGFDNDVTIGFMFTKQERVQTIMLSGSGEW